MHITTTFWALHWAYTWRSLIYNTFKGNFTWLWTNMKHYIYLTIFPIYDRFFSISMDWKSFFKSQHTLKNCFETVVLERDKISLTLYLHWNDNMMRFFRLLSTSPHAGTRQWWFFFAKKPYSHCGFQLDLSILILSLLRLALGSP